MGKRTWKGQKSGVGPLFFQMLLWSTLAWVVLLSITLGVTLQFSLSTLEKKIENGLAATTSSLAESEMVRKALLDGYCSEELIEYLDNLVSRTEDMDVVTIADTDSIRLYHVVHERIGQEFVGGDQGPALQGKSYFSDAVGTLGMQHRAFAPIRDTDGTVLGFVVASTTMQLTQNLRSSIVETYSHLALVLMAATLLLSAGLSLLVRRMLHGFSAEELVHNYLTQNEVLNNLDEGVVSVDGAGKVQLVNQAAEEMLGKRAELLEGSGLDALIRDKDGGSLLTARSKNVATSRPNVLACCIPLEKNGKRVGTTLILTDKSEAMRAAEQLGGTRHIVSSLRANSHEFMNKLQVISGLLQMDRAGDALDYIRSVSATQSKIIGPVLQHIQNPNVAALILGKLDNLRELDIQLTMLANSHLPEHSRYLSTADLVTLVGNLLENAMEAVNAQAEDGPRSVVLQITEDGSGLIIMVSDTGTGIPDELLERIYNPGFSTKAAEGRGMGMSLIRGIVERRNGSIEADSEPGSGTTFTLIFNEERKGK